jgi:hypothetical protein
MCKYKATYDGKQIELEAESSYQAQQKAAEILKVRPKKVYMISVTLLQRDDRSPVVHMPLF